MNKPIIRRCFTGALTLALALSVLPAVTLGTETKGLCQHHSAHTADCGYTETTPCKYDTDGCDLCREDSKESVITIIGTDVTIDGHTFPYTGEAITPAITVTVAGKTLTEGEHYSVTYENNIQPGTAQVTVKGIASEDMTTGYTGEVTISFTIEEAPQKPEQPDDSEKPDSDKPDDSEETTPVQYKITKGNQATWYMGSGKALSFTANGEHSKFTGISINGKMLDEDLYAAKQGTTVALKTSYLNTLTVGKYAITIHFEDGDAEGTFTVSNQLDTSNPVTGDYTPITGLLLTAVISLAALGCTAFVILRKVRR